MITIDDERKCCGCRACEDVCPHKCISMTRGTLGHLFPKIDRSKCISCNLCLKVCPIQNKPNNGIDAGETYVAFNKNKEIRSISSSGGLFYSLASYFVQSRHYKVFGARFDDQLKLKTVEVDNIEDILSLCKSKYLQSNTSGIYKRIKQLLDNNEGVLFCGTPCQIAALKLFLNKDYEKLFLIDFFCHGVPSQEYFDKCIELVERKKKIQVLSYSYRTKKQNGVTPHYYTIKYSKNGKLKVKTDFYYNSPNYAAFQTYVNLRESCYRCIYSDSERFSDLTIGDFHEIEKYRKDINRFDGVSLLIANTEKGKQILANISESIKTMPIDKNKLINDKVIFVGGTSRPINRDNFIHDYEKMSFSKLQKKWFGKRKYFKHIVYYHLPNRIRKVMKRIGGL